jgi:hypothetical protein
VSRQHRCLGIKSRRPATDRLRAVLHADGAAVHGHAMRHACSRMTCVLRRAALPRSEQSDEAFAHRAAPAGHRTRRGFGRAAGAHDYRPSNSFILDFFRRSIAPVQCPGFKEASRGPTAGTLRRRQVKRASKAQEPASPVQKSRRTLKPRKTRARPQALLGSRTGRRRLRVQVEHCRSCRPNIRERGQALRTPHRLNSCSSCR